jgi:hypothetical protein
MRPKSCTLVRTLRRDMDTAAVDMVTHVRLMVSRRVVALEHCIVARGPRAAKGKVVVEVNLQNVWEACTARTVLGPAPPSSLQVPAHPLLPTLILSALTKTCNNAHAGCSAC